MRTTVLSIICILTIILNATAQEPEIHWYMGGSNEESVFARCYTWVGDQNDDGCDELLVAMEDSIVAMYFGGEEMDTNPDMIFEPYHEIEFLNWGHSFLGNLTGNGPYNFAIHGLERLGDWRDPSISRVYIYEGNEDLDTIPDFYISMYNESNTGGLLMYPLDRPCNINGDGFNDLIVVRSFRNYEDIDLSELQVYYGSAEFDTIPDVIVTHDYWGQSFGSHDIRSGYDLNGDGCDEILVKSDYTGWSLYLGGAPMDTVSLAEFNRSSYDPMLLLWVGMIPDINGDGYDEMTMGLYRYDEENDERIEREWIFFGRDTLSFEVPDRSLQPGEGLWPGSGDSFGGDLNDDGYGDVLVNTGAYSGMNDIRIYFGSPWVDSTFSVEINGYDIQALRGMSLRQSAHGDFNGDGVSDFIIYAEPILHHAPRLVIMLGNPRWQYGVAEDEYQPFDYGLHIRARPNPFNSILRVSYALPVAGDVSLNVYDLTGRHVAELVHGNFNAGIHNTVFDGADLSSGIYLLRLESGSEVSMVKVVLVK